MNSFLEKIVAATLAAATLIVVSTAVAAVAPQAERPSTIACYD